MLKVKLFTAKGTGDTGFTMPKEFDGKFSQALLDQAIRVYEDRTHFGFAKVKTRGEVDMTKKKVYKQKGTGGARHGAKSAPIFVGGGKAHGPKGVKKVLTLPIKIKRKALTAAVSFVVSNKRAVVAESLSNVKKTAEAVKVLSKIRQKMEVKSTILAVLPDEAATSLKFFKNIEKVRAVLYKDLNAFILLRAGFVVFDASVFEKKGEKRVKTASKKIK